MAELPAGQVKVTGERFRATVDPQSDDFLLRFIGFEPEGSGSDDDSILNEALRALGYVE